MSVLEYRSGLDEKADPARGFRGAITRHWLGWAIYLGMSWTWCIGMFLPVLLIRDYGPWAWVVFAVPNVIGAAAMGWVLREGQSEKLIEHHRPAVVAFSFVTVVFQIFFSLWQFKGIGIAIPVVALLFLVAAARSDVWAIVLGGVALGISLICMGGVGSQWISEAPSRMNSGALAGLSSVCAFGFALCPYLDGTFHRAFQATPRGRLSFSVGFGVFFLVMILFTLMYAPAVIGWRGTSQLWPWLYIHWAVQLAFTIALHWQICRPTWTWKAGTIATAALIWMAAPAIHYRTILSEELVYRFFMSFYGLMFPAYVWICMVPNWREPISPDRGQWIVLAIAVAVAAPFYWVAFFDGRMVWVVPGVLIVLAARFAVPKRVVTA
jgi:hypothetical protein